MSPRDYYLKNRERILARQRDYYRANRQARRERYLKNRDRVLARQRDYNLKNRQARRDYYLKNRERILARQRDYDRANRERILAQQQIYHAQNKQVYESREALRQTGWRLDREVVQLTKEVAKQRAMRPGRLVTEILRKKLSQLTAPISTAELAARIFGTDVARQRANR